MSRSRSRPSSHEPTARATTPPKNQTIARAPTAAWRRGTQPSDGPAVASAPAPGVGDRAARRRLGGRGVGGRLVGHGPTVPRRSPGRGWSRPQPGALRAPAPRCGRRTPARRRRRRRPWGPAGPSSKLRAVALGVEAPEVAEAHQLLTVTPPPARCDHWWGNGSRRPPGRRRRAPHDDVAVTDHPPGSPSPVRPSAAPEHVVHLTDPRYAMPERCFVRPIRARGAPTIDRRGRLRRPLRRQRRVRLRVRPRPPRRPLRPATSPWSPAWTPGSTRSPCSASPPARPTCCATPAPGSPTTCCARW